MSLLGDRTQGCPEFFHLSFAPLPRFPIPLTGMKFCPLWPVTRDSNWTQFVATPRVTTLVRKIGCLCRM